MNPSQAPNAPGGDDPLQALEALSAQRDLALRLLEQGQHEQWQRVTFQQALLAAAAQQQQHSAPFSVNQSMAELGNEVLDAGGGIRGSGVASAELHRDLLVELERQRQRAMPQQESSTSQSAEFQQNISFDVERQRQIIQNLQQQSSQQQNLQMQLESSTLLQQNLGRLLSAGLSQEYVNGTTPSATTRPSGVNSTDLDRLLATESLLRRSRLQDAVSMLQNQGVLLEDTLNRGSTEFSSANASPAPWLSRPNDPILSQLLHAAANNCASLSNRPANTGSQSIGHMGLLPGSITSIEIPRDSTNSTKRNSEEPKGSSRKEVKKQKAAHKAGSGSCFPLPSRKHSRKISMKLSSFHALWNKLGDCALRQEIFRRRLSSNFKASNKTAGL